MPPQTANKQFEFTATPGSTFIMILVSSLLYYVPLVGFAFAFNNQAEWFAKNTKINGQAVTYKAEFSETWVIMFVGILLTLVTFGIYLFWFIPKLYRFAFDHMTLGDVSVAVPSSASALPSTPAPVVDATAAVPATSSTEGTTPPTNLVQ